MVEETRKFGVVALVAITVIAVLFGVLAGAKAKKLSAQLREETAKRTALEQEAKKLDKALKELEQKANEIVAQNKALVSENKRLKEDLARAQKEIQKLKNEIRDLENLKAILEKNIKDMSKLVPKEKLEEIGVRP